MAAIAPVLFPEMKERGAKPGDLVALLSATGAQTETIPPSIVLITIGSVTGVSITALFTGGMLPGVVLAIALCLVVWWRYRKEDLSHVRRATWGEIGRLFLIAIPAIALPFIIRAAVIEGVATATEVSTIGIVYAVLAGLLIYRHFDWRRLWPMLVETASLSGAILLIIGAATGMAWALTQSGFSRDLAAVMGSLPGGAIGFLAVSIVAFIILGSVLEGIPAIVLFGPLLFPDRPRRSASTRCTTRWWSSSPWAWACSRRRSASATTPPARSAASVPTKACGRSSATCWRCSIGLLVVAAVPWISIGFLG